MTVQDVYAGGDAGSAIPVSGVELRHCGEILLNNQAIWL